MTYDQVIDHYQTATRAAKCLGMTDKGIYKWKETGIDPLRQSLIQLLTGGKLKADLPSHYHQETVV